MAKCVIGAGVTAGACRGISEMSSGNKGVLLVVMMLLVVSVVVQNSHSLI
jgi:hypothetical protein